MQDFSCKLIDADGNCLFEIKMPSGSYSELLEDLQDLQEYYTPQEIENSFKPTEKIYKGKWGKIEIRPDFEFED